MSEAAQIVRGPKRVHFAMRGLGYDLKERSSTSLDDLSADRFDFVATTGCGDACPFVRAKRREDWAIPVPKHLPPEEFRGVGADLEMRVRAVLASL